MFVLWVGYSGSYAGTFANSRTGCDVLNTVGFFWQFVWFALDTYAPSESESPSSSNPNKFLFWCLQHFCSTYQTFLSNMKTNGAGSLRLEVWRSKIVVVVVFPLQEYGIADFSNSVWFLNFGFSGRCLTFGSIMLHYVNDTICIWTLYDDE